MDSVVTRTKRPDRAHSRHDTPWGTLLKHARTARRLSRSAVVDRYHNLLVQRNPTSDEPLRSEAWLARVERSEIGIARACLELLFDALECSAYERAQVLTAADRSPLLATCPETAATADLLALAMIHLQNDPQVHTLLVHLLRDQRLATLERAEVLEIIAEALTLACDRRQPPRAL